jgi:hypothetical protein
VVKVRDLVAELEKHDQDEDVFMTSKTDKQFSEPERIFVAGKGGGIVIEGD